jgi:Common central domain of tyrosinase
LEKLKTNFFLVLIAAMLVLLNPMRISQGQVDNLICNVEIVGGSQNMYPGQSVNLVGNVTGQKVKDYTWTVEGPIIKEYDDNIYNSTYLTAFLNIDPPTYMSPADFKGSSISFYWQPNNTDTSRTVSLRVETEDSKVCEDSKEFTVVKNNDNIDLQAEDFFVEQNHPVGVANDGRVETRVLRQHEQWHLDQRSIDDSYSKKGATFFDFHRLYIAHFDAWRDLFGYPRISAWDPATPIPVGIEINHTNRNQSAQAFELPPWFRYQAGADGPVNRTILFVRNFTGQDQLPEGHPLANSGLQIRFVGPVPLGADLDFLNGHTVPMCEEMDYSSATSGYPLAQDALNDFEPDQNLLGCALTNPYHDANHGEIAGDDGGDMGGIEHSPRDPLFWRYHKFIDNVSVQRFFPPSPLSTDRALVEESDIITLSDTIPPQIISQNPFREPGRITSLPTISENEKGLFGVTGISGVSITFNEPINGIKPSDFTINGSPATQVRGTGLGPYVFVGFKEPETELINVTILPGNITDIVGNQFEGSSWNYTLIRHNLDKDRDGLKDQLEIEWTYTNPYSQDSDGDTMLDGEEASSNCLNPLVNDQEGGLHMVNIIDAFANMDMSHETDFDFDKDNSTNVEEIQNKTDPCSANSEPLDVSLETDTEPQNSTGSSLNGNSLGAMPFSFIMKKTGGIAGTISQLQYDSATKTAISVMNGTTSVRQVSAADEMLLQRALNDSGFFESENFYPPSNGTDYFEYTLIATFNNKLNAVYWTDVSKEVPPDIENLPFILAHILKETGFQGS